MINDDDDNDDDSDRAKEFYEKDDIEMIANGVADVEYHIPVPGMPVYNSNLRCGTRTRKPTVHYEANSDNKNYSYSDVPVSSTGNVNVHNDDPPLEAMDKEDAMIYLLGVVMVQQFSLNKGLKEFGDRDKDATMKELTQIRDMDTHHPLDASTLTWEQRKRALPSILFLVEKRCGDIKGKNVCRWK